MSFNYLNKVKEAVSQFLTLNNRLIFYSSLQILFTIVIVILFSQFLFAQFKSILIQNEVRLYQQLVNNHYQDKQTTVTHRIQAAFIATPTLHHPASSATRTALQDLLNETGTDFVFLLDPQGKPLYLAAQASRLPTHPDLLAASPQLKPFIQQAKLGFSKSATETIISPGIQDKRQPALPTAALSIIPKNNDISGSQHLCLVIAQPIFNHQHKIQQIVLSGLFLNPQTDFISDLNTLAKPSEKASKVHQADFSLAAPDVLLDETESAPHRFPVFTLYNLDHHPVGTIQLDARQTPTWQQIDQLWEYLLLIRFISLIIGIFLAFLMTKSLLRPILRLAKKSQSILDGNLNVHIEEVPQKDEMSILNNTISRMVKQLLHNNSLLEALVAERTQALQASNEKLKEKEDALLKQNEELLAKEAQLILHNEELETKEAKLTEYITRLSEQQEWERVVKWMVTSIRESLELDEVIRRTTQEIGQLLNVDECFITAYQPKQDQFIMLHDFKAASQAEQPIPLMNLSERIKRQICDQMAPIVINNVHLFSQDASFEEQLGSVPLKSLVILPLVHNQELLGTLTVRQNTFYRIWSEREIEFLKDIAQQVSIAIRQARLYAAAQEATRLKSEFLANMSHELRTPLNAILGFSEMIQSKSYGPLTSKQEDYIQNVIISGRHLLTLVNDVLDLSKVESGNMELHYELFDVQHIIQEAISIIRVIAHKKQILINVAINPYVRFAYADISRFKQILYNLLSNAIKFTKEGGMVSLRTYLDEQDPNTLLIDIADTGIGISEEDRHIVFSEFQQIDASYARVQEGSGLGLALTKTLVEMHDGTIDFISQVGVGTVFTFSIPCHISGEIPDKDATNYLSNYHQELVKTISTLPQNKPQPAQVPDLRALPILNNTLSSPEKLPNILIITSTTERFHQLKEFFQNGKNGDYQIYAALSETEIYRHYLENELPDLLIMDITLFEHAHGNHIVHSLKSRSNWSAIPLIFATTEASNEASDGAIFGKENGPNLCVRSLGAIDYLFTSSSEQILLNHLEKIRYNIVKEDFIRVLILGNSYIASRLTGNHWPEWNRKRNHFKIIHIPYPNATEPLQDDPEIIQQALSKSPDIILIEMSRFLESSMLVLLEQLKSRIETKYIPIILIQSVHSEGPASIPSSIAAHTRRSNEMIPNRHESIETMKEPLSPSLSFNCRGNLNKDVEYALRIKRQRGELYRECI